MDIVKQLRKQQKLGWDNINSKELIDFGQAADEIERLRENCFGYPALMDNLSYDMLIALHDHIHTIIDEREGGNISQARKAKAKKARSALQQKESE